MLLILICHVLFWHRSSMQIKCPLGVDLVYLSPATTTIIESLSHLLCEQSAVFWARNEAIVDAFPFLFFFPFFSLYLRGSYFFNDQFEILSFLDAPHTQTICILVLARCLHFILFFSVAENSIHGSVGLIVIFEECPFDQSGFPHGTPQSRNTSITCL